MPPPKTELALERDKIEFQAGVLSRRFSEKAASILPDNQVAQAMSLTAASQDVEQQLWQRLMGIGEEGNKFVFLDLGRLELVLLM